MQVKELREELKLLGLIQAGNKPDLIQQLIKAREDQVQYLTVTQAENPELSNLVNIGLPLSAYWQLFFSRYKSCF